MCTLRSRGSTTHTIGTPAARYIINLVFNLAVTVVFRHHLDSEGRCDTKRSIRESWELRRREPGDVRFQAAR